MSYALFDFFDYSTPLTLHFFVFGAPLDLLSSPT
jgi:hypothetical protein